VGLYEDLIKTTKRLEKTNMLSEFLRRSKSEDIPNLILLMQGKIFPNWDEKKIGVASKLILKAINVSTGISLNKIESEWKKTGDLGNVAENLVRSKQQVTLFSSSLSVKKVFLNLRKLAELEGMGAVERKVKLISELLTSAKPLEAKYVVRTVLEELRVGVGEGSLRDAIVWAFFSDKVKLKYLKDENNIDVTDRGTYNKYIDAVQSAYDLTNDFSIVANTAKSKGLDGLLALQLEVGRPLKVMLALKVLDVDSGFLRCGKPADIEYKLDGFRIQVHKKGSNVRLFTRRLEEVTGQFPEVVRYVKENVKCDSVILDSEAVGFNPKTGKYLPFQKISQRIKRKYDILEMSKKFPVELNVFDIIYYNGESLLKENFSKRRKLIEEVVLNKTRKIVVVRNLVTSDKKDAEKFYRESLSAGNEGVMFKNLESPYKPGARVKHMVKLKPVMDTLDLVIVAAEWGKAKGQIGLVALR